MALDLIQQSFNAGEWSPLLDGRSALEKYYSACRVLENMIPTRYGPAERRPGLYYVAELKDSSQKARLLPFKYSTVQAYMLEFGNEYIRFFKDRGQIIAGIGTEDLSAFDSAVGDSTLLAHWLLNDNLADQVVLDNSIAGTHVGETITANTSALHATGHVGTGCLNLAGVDAVKVGDAAALSFDDSGDNPFSIAAWVYVSNAGYPQRILSKWKKGIAREWLLGVNEDLKLRLILCDDSIDLSASRVAHWKLNDNAANTAVDDDVAAVPHDGVATANTEDLHITGRVGTGCFDFDGQYAVEVNDHNALTFVEGVNGDFSISAWIYVSASGVGECILSKWRVGSAREWRLRLTTDDKPQFVLYDVTNSKQINLKADDALSAGWHFVCATYEGEHGSWTGPTAMNYANIYVDGSAVAATATNDAGYVKMVNQVTKVVIGGRYSAAPALEEFFQDKIDNVALFSKTLSADEVSSLWNNGIGEEDLEGSFPYRISDDALTEGWHFVAATYDSTGGATAANGIILYVDGAAVDSTATNVSDYVAMEGTATDVLIGACYASDDTLSGVWADKIDDVALFTEHLSAANIASLYSTGAYEIASPYLEADLFGIQRIQSADVMYGFHSGYNPRKLMRYAHDNWELESIDFDWPPFLDENKTDITITPTGAGAAPLVVGASITLTASSAIFTSNHIGSYWLIKHPRTGDESVAPNKVGSAEADGFFNAATEVTASLKDVEGSWNFRTAGTWTGEIAIERSYDEGTTWQTLQTFTSEGDLNFNVPGEETLGDAWLRARAVDPPGTLAWANEAIPTLSVERYYHYGIVKVTAFTSATVVTGEVIRAINSESATKLWSEGAWSDERGYPSCGTFHEERLMVGGTTYQPHRIDGSMTDDWENFRTGTLDDHSVSYALAANEMNATRWLMSKEVLLMGTAGAEWKLGSFDADEPLTPGNPVKPRLQTTYGSKNIQAIMLANVVLFVQSEGRVVRGAQYVFEKGESGGYDSPDYTTLAGHITESGIVSMAYQQQPEPILWCVLDNGNAIGMTFEPGQKIWGWFPVVTDGDFEDVAVIPGVSEDEVWWIVNRTKGDGTVIRCIEYMKPRDWGSDQKDCFFVDSGLTFDGGDAVTITGITKANPAVVTMDTYPTDGDGNNIADGDQVRIRYVGGMSEVNNKVFTVSNPNVSAKTFELRDKLDTVDIDSTGYTVFAASITGDTTYDSTDIKNVSAADIAKLEPRAPITGTGIPDDTIITAIEDDWFTMSNEATVTGTDVTITIGGTAEKVANTFSGLDHQEGKTFSVLGDGTVHDDVVITSGIITLTEYYNKVQAGLPYNSDLMPMKTEFQTGMGTVRAKVKRTHQAVFSFYNSLGCTYGSVNDDGTPDLTETIPFRKTTDAMGEAVPLFTGEKTVPFPGRYGLEGNLFVRQSQPLPLTVRSIVQRMKLYG